MKRVTLKAAQLVAIILLIMGSFVPQIAAGSGQIVSTDKDLYNYGEMINVKFSNAPGKDSDWLCIAPAGSPDTEAGDYKNMPKGVSQGTLVFDAPVPGKYEARAYYNYSRNGYVVAGRHAFSVNSSPAHEGAMAARMTRKIDPTNSLEANIPPGKGLVYLFREGLFVSAGIEVPVYANGKRIALMQNSSYLPVILPEGDVKFTADKTRENDRGEIKEVEAIRAGEATVTVKSGYVQYVKVRITLMGLWVLFVDQIPHEEGAGIIKSYNLTLIK
ncbi:MAG: hypothetical protein ACYDG4_16570 [Desulfuromonadaceae bacterium]